MEGNGCFLNAQCSVLRGNNPGCYNPLAVPDLVLQCQGNLAVPLVQQSHISLIPSSGWVFLYVLASAAPTDVAAG